VVEGKDIARTAQTTKWFNGTGVFSVTAQVCLMAMSSANLCVMSNGPMMMVPCSLHFPGPDAVLLWNIHRRSLIRVHMSSPGPSASPSRSQVHGWRSGLDGCGAKVAFCCACTLILNVHALLIHFGANSSWTFWDDQWWYWCQAA